MTTRTPPRKYTDKNEIAARLRAEIQALVRLGETRLAVQICEEEVEIIRDQQMSNFALDKVVKAESAAAQAGDTSKVVRFDKPRGK